jgi:hypothetical protein
LTSGHSDTPLARKLSLRDGQRVWFDGMPESIADEIGEYALELIFVDPSRGVDAAHVFVTERADLAVKLARLRDQVVADGQVWVSWPKESAGVTTDITEDTIRELALPLGFLDTKACEIDEIWSGLKLVVRKELR